MKKLIKGEYLEVLLRSPQSVFTTKDVALLWNESNNSIIADRLKSYVNNGKLVRIRRGIYSKDKKYNKYEFAVKIFRPSYVSFETVLGASGMTFQYYGNIFVASYLKREIKSDNQTYSFVKMKDSILSNPKGIDQTGEYAIASKERAFLDTIYRSKKYYIDNYSPLDWDKVFEILPIYNNKKMEKTVKKYYDDFKKSEEENKI
jgi:hypothetical protein